ncbi:MAG: DUF4249 domain-containing protein [Paludibacter sp.]|nr:DUF4249 domain-containing protein [Paludibacter sp.]
MKTIYKIISILLGIFLFVSCEKEIVFKGEIADPMVVVNSYITPDSIISAHISESRFFLNDTTTFKNISNADVSVFVNGVFKEKMGLVEEGNYKGTYKPVIGETIKLIVKVPDKKDVSSEAIIEPKPDILSLDTTNIWTGKSYNIQNVGYLNGSNYEYKLDTISTVTGHIINYKLKFNDNGNQKNYYRLVVNTKERFITVNKFTNDTITEIRDNYTFNFTDIVSGNNSTNDPLSAIGGSSSDNIYNVFSDDLFNGKTYSLTFSTNEDIYNYSQGYDYGLSTPVDKTVYVYLQSITRDYYLYLLSRPVAVKGSDFFSEPVQIHNNIVGGIGILGSYTSGNVYKVELK